MLAFSPCLTCFVAILLGKQANKHTKKSLGQALGGNQEGVQVCVAPGLGYHSPRTWNASPLLQTSTAVTFGV